MKCLQSTQVQWIPVTLVMAASLLYRVVDSATDSLALLTLLRSIAVLALVLGLVAVWRQGGLLTGTLWAVMLVSAATALSDTLILALPETDAITAERQASRATAVSNVIGYAVVVSLAVRIGANNAWYAALVVFSYAAIFAPTWPFLSPGMDELVFFVARWVLMATAIGVIGIVSLGFRSFDAWSAPRRRLAVLGLRAWRTFSS